MQRETFEQTLRTFQHLQPFRSFAVELESGDRIQVDHPEAMVVRAGRAVYVSAQGELSIFDYDGVSQILGEARQSA